MNAKHRWIAVFVICVALAALALAWLYGPYRPRQAVAAAEDFITLLQADRHDEAFALTLGDASLLGGDRAAFRADAAHQLCARRPIPVVDVHPFQSNGNRLRRRLRGSDPDQDRLWVRFQDFDQNCTMSIQLRRDAKGLWRIYSFGSTAG